MPTKGLGRKVAPGRVAEAEHHFARIVKLVDGGDTKAFAKRNPNIRAQTIAIDVTNSMSLVQGGAGSGEKVTEDLAYVNEVGRL